jgi:hypothetical protein
VRPRASLALLLLALVAAACSSGGNPGTTSGAAMSTPGATPVVTGPVLLGLNTGPAPWPPEQRFLPQRLRAIGLPPLGPEVTRIHFHVNLVVDVLGRNVVVPFGVGIDFRKGLLAEIHTHADRGTIHIEAAKAKRFTLGMVFDVWGVRFSADCIGGYCDDGTNTIRVFLDGRPYTKNPADLLLANDQVIVVAYGTAQQVPNPMPARFVYEGTPKPA